MEMEQRATALKDEERDERKESRNASALSADIVSLERTQMLSNSLSPIQGSPGLGKADSSRRGTPDSIGLWWQNLDFNRSRGSNSGDPDGALSALQKGSFSILDELQIFWHACKESWRSLSWTMFLTVLSFFFVMSVAGCALVWIWSQRQESERRKEAISISQETGLSIGRELQRIFAPVFTLRGYVFRTPALLNLSLTAQSYPFKPNSSPTRIVQNIPLETIDLFNEFAAELFWSLGSETSSSLVALQLSPRGIVSAIYPLEGQEAVIGLDVLNADRDVRYDILRTVADGTFSMIGPFQFLQGWSGILGNLPLFVNESVPGSLDTSTMEFVEKTVYEGKNLWGIITATLNFEDLISTTKTREVMYAHHLRFKMTRNETTVIDGVRGWQTVTFFESDADAIVSGESVPVPVPNNVWTIHVDRIGGFSPSWLAPACVAVVAGALLLSTLVALLALSYKRQRHLLYRIIPPRAVKRLQKGEQVADSYGMTTFFFSDLVGFTSMSSRKSAMEVVEMLNDLFTDFDKLAQHHNVFKVDTIGDAYMVVAGAPERCDGAEGAARVAGFALDALEQMRRSGSGLRIRAGMASGPAVAAVLGTSVPKYSFFGDTVNTASRMESTGEAGRLQVTEATKRLLEESGQPFSIEARAGDVQVKGKGVMQTFWVTRPLARRGALEPQVVIT